MIPVDVVENRFGMDSRDRRYRDLFDALDEAVCFIERLPDGADGRRDYRYLDLNPAMKAMFGVGDLAGGTIRQHFPDEAESWYDDYDRVLLTGRPVRFQRRSDPQGKVLDMLVSRVGDEHRPLLMVVMRDVSAAHAADTALRESRNALRRLNETLEQRVEERTAERDRMWSTSPDLMVEASLEGIYERANPAWMAILGYEPAEVVGRTAVDFVHPEDMDAMAAALAKAQADTLPGINLRFRRKDGGFRWIQWVAAPSAETIFAIGRDVTAAIEAEQVLQATEAQLRQAQKMEAVGQLTGGLAHDFNNLLAGISGALDMIQARMAQRREQEVPRYVDAAQDAARRAAALTHRLLAFSRRQTLDPRPTDVDELIEGMADLVKRSIGPGIALDLRCAATRHVALVDPSQLESALLNLCINARDAMPDGGNIAITTANVHLEAEAAAVPEAAAGDYIVVSVTDTGTGMSPETAAKAFDPFFTTKPLGQGTGLGLSMIYGFARQSGGHVRLRSDLGLGTTIAIYLPCHGGDAEVPTSPPTATRSAPDGTRQVLVVDDEPIVRMLVCEMLEDMGYVVSEAADSVTGLAALRSDAPIDLLVTDVGLPGGMNGRQMAEAGQQLRPWLKVLLITGYAEGAVVGTQELGPGMRVLTKPFAADALAARLQDVYAA